MIVAPFLKKGDTIGITCTARSVNKSELRFAIEYLESKGFKVVLSESIDLENGIFAGTELERAKAFNLLLSNKVVKAVLCARGGYGTVKMIDLIDFEILVQHPKWIIGFSDVTILLNQLYASNIASIHGPMPILFQQNTSESLESLIQTLSGKLPEYTWNSTLLNKIGNGVGELIGGNLSLLVNSIGTVSEVDTCGKILFIEDIGEYLYHIDRMMNQLDRAKKLSNLAGIVIGSMSDMKDNEQAYGLTIFEIIHSFVNKYNYPIAFDAPFGHQPDNRALVFGFNYSLHVYLTNTVLKPI